VSSSNQLLDNELIEELKKEWEGFKKSYNKASIPTKLGVIQQTMTPDFADFCWSLVLVFGYGALQQILGSIKEQGIFKSKSSNLMCLMKNSKEILPWQDFPTVDEGREKRNDIAHEQNI
jgi:hypothetical protein